MDQSGEEVAAQAQKGYRPVGQFDPNYEKPIIATIVGGVILVAGILANITVNRWVEDYHSIYRWSWIFIRIGASAWCVYLAKQQNRSMIGWGLFGLISPGMALIFIGLQEKKRPDLAYGPVFEFEEKHRYKYVVTKKTADGQVLTIYSCLPVGYTVGDLVTIDDKPAPSGRYRMEWNHYLTVEAGRILKL